MFISGFTIIKNAIINEYPIVEAINSILPLVDEMIVLVGDSEDDTLQLIESINNDKIKIHHSVWDQSLRKDGLVLSVETNKAFGLINPNADWAFYIQADEAIHEKYLPTIKLAMEQYKDDKRVDGLLFNYLHFYGTYDYIGDSRRWYSKEIRVIKNDRSISSYKDAQGFKKDGKKLKVILINAFVYHYGWVKSLKQMKLKINNFSSLWEENLTDKIRERFDSFDFKDFDSIQKFEGTHPIALKERIEQKNWEIEFPVNQKRMSLKNFILYKFEKITGTRLFEYKNYKLIGRNSKAVKPS